jgi:tetratricopeptide (TPR) repeat protein
MIRTSSLLLLLVPAIALARSSFDKHYEAGQDAYHLGKLEEASAAFAKARDLSPDKPGPWRWLGRTARARKQWDECLEAAIQALRLSPRSRYSAEVRRDVEACRAALGRPPFDGKLGADQGAIHVPISVNLGELRVTVDGLSRGAPPVVFPVNAGKHRVELAPTRGGAPVQVWVDVLPGIVHDVTVP